MTTTILSTVSLCYSTVIGHHDDLGTKREGRWDWRAANRAVEADAVLANHGLAGFVRVAEADERSPALLLSKERRGG